MMRALVLVALVACSGDGDRKIPTGPTDTQTPVPTPKPGPTTPSTDQDLDGYALPFDCDDTDPTIHPEADDPPYDGVDSDCAGDSDFDADRDGFDSDDYGGTDCDDSDDTVLPGGIESCDGRDGDCDGEIDSPTPPDADTWYRDFDGDGQGDPGDTALACDPPSGYVPGNTDCDDTDPYTYLGAAPVACDGIENDCDASIMENGAGASIGGVAYASVDLALQAAQSGDVVELCEGRHVAADLAVTTGLTLTGVFDADQTALDAQGLGPLLQVSTSEPVTLAHLTLTGGMGFDVGTENLGGGLRTSLGSDVTLDDVIVEVNHAGSGGGIYVGPNASLTLVRSRVEFNNADLCLTVCSGGGIATGTGATVVLEGSTVSDNFSGNCAGVDLGAGGSLAGTAIDRGVITNNFATLVGGGLCADQATLSYLNVNTNDASVGAGMDVDDVVVLDVEIRSNTSTLEGGGVNVGGDATFEDVLVDDNEGFSGGGYSFHGTGTLTLVGGQVSGNRATFATAESGGVDVLAGTLVSDGTDWATGGSDNIPHDIYLLDPDLIHDETGVASFVCDSALGTCQ